MTLPKHTPYLNGQGGVRIGLKPINEENWLEIDDKFKDEITDLTFDKGGILAMANSGPATNGSQFFITHGKTDWLDGKHTVFGYVIEGQDIVNNISQGDTIDSVTIERHGTAAKEWDALKAFEEFKTYLFLWLMYRNIE